MENRAKGLFIPNYKNATLKTYLIDQVSDGVNTMTWDMTQFITFLLQKYENTNVILDWEKEFSLYVEEEYYYAEVHQPNDEQ